LEEELSVKEIENVDEFLTQNSIIKEMAWKSISLLWRCPISKWINQYT
jgi:hypothetical protein